MECDTYRPITPMDLNAVKIFDQLTDAQKKFDKALDQIGVIDLQLRDLETRYKRAVKNKKNSFRYNLRLKLSVVTGIKMMYNHFATKKAEEIRRYTRQLENIYGNEMQNFDPRDPNSRPEQLIQDSPEHEGPSGSLDLGEPMQSSSSSSAASSVASSSASSIASISSSPPSPSGNEDSDSNDM